MSEFTEPKKVQLIAVENPSPEKNQDLANQGLSSNETIAIVFIGIAFVLGVVYLVINKDKIVFEDAIDVQGANAHKVRARAIVEHIFKSDAHAKVEDTLNGKDITAQTLQFNGSGNTNCVITIDKNLLQLPTSQLNLQQMLDAVENMNRSLTALNQMKEVQFLRTNYGVFNLVGIIEDSQGFKVKRYIISLNTIELQQMLVKASELYTQQPLPSKNLLKSAVDKPFEPGNWGD